jgi:alpha-beta hydrolase superfamily lysophospholipase/SAM-dependent methyltransferase
VAAAEDYTDVLVNNLGDHAAREADRMTAVHDLSLAPAAREPTEHTLTLRDGADLFYRAWLPQQRAEKALVLFHRGHEHSGRWQETVEALNLPDWAVFAWDQRGHGRSAGERGDAPDIATVAADADEFVRHLSKTYGVPVENMVVLAHSVGAVIATAWVHDFAPPIRGMILATPAFRVKLYIPLAIPMLRLKEKLLGPGTVKSYVKATMLTHDGEEAEKYRADPLIFRQISVRMLLALYDTSTRLLADAGAITVPTLMLVSGADWVVKQSAQRTFFDRLSSPHKRIEELPGFYHAVFHETDRALAVAKVRDFAAELFAKPPSPVSLLDADKNGYTKAEYDRLRGPGPLRFAVTRGLMKTAGRLSRGVDLGWKSGFDSGVTLDYVYENRPRGTTFLGRMIDRSYMNSIGWRGIRLRRVHMQQALRQAIQRTQADGRPVRILDIASGPGRYVLDTIRQMPEAKAEVVLRDYKEENLEAARKLAAEFGLANVTVMHGDAFDADSLAAVTPRPTIAIVSGLYELIPENEPLQRSLAGLARALEPGGTLIYTNQPWHPQVEFIARVLTNREGQPWIMRRRTQAEMDELVRSAGFSKQAQEIDPWGIFSVSVATRTAS